MDPKKQGNKSQQKVIRNQNVLEALKDIGSSTGTSFKKDLVQGTSRDIIRQMLGESYKPRKVSGDIMPGESVEIDKAYSGEHQRVVQEKRQLSFLNRLKEQEVHQVESRSNELKIQLNRLQQELLALMESTQSLSEETEVAAMSVPADPGIYHINYFEKLIEFVRSFRRQIGSADMWMQASNKRSQKKDYWSKYKKNGSKFLLSADHYLTRSAG